MTPMRTFRPKDESGASWQFGLRSLLLFMLITGPLIAWFVPRVHRVIRRQMEGTAPLPRMAAPSDLPIPTATADIEAPFPESEF
jgi:hypothetical protein